MEEVGAGGVSLAHQPACFRAQGWDAITQEWLGGRRQRLMGRGASVGLAAPHAPGHLGRTPANGTFWLTERGHMPFIRAERP